MDRWLKDEDLEKLFQDGTDGNNFEYDPEAWDQMESILDNYQRKRRIFFWVIIGVIILLSAGIFWFQRSRISHARELEKASTIIAVNETNETSDLIDVSGDNQETKKSSDFIEPLGNENLDLSSIRTDILPNSQVVDRIKGFDHSIIEKNVIENLKNSMDKQQELSSPVKIWSDNSYTNGRVELSSIQRLSIQLLDSPYRPKDVQMPTQIIPTEEKDGKHRPFMLGFFVGAESSSTPTTGFTQTDFTFGFSASYFVSRRLAVSFGASYIKDNYKAGKEDYRPPKGFWENEIAPDYTSAHCTMIEVPIGFQYNFTDLYKSGIFSQASIVSIFMLRENYYYRYEEDPNKNFSSMWVNANKDLMSTVDISLGYRKNMKGPFSISIAPYAKIPITGIGHGNIMLSSIGLRLQINWNTK